MQSNTDETNQQKPATKKMIALIAHDKKKVDLCALVSKYKKFFSSYPQLCATGTTGGRLISEIGLENVKRFASGPLGGDSQIGAEMTCGHIECIIFFRDPLTAHPHEPDVAALSRLADVHNTPIATCVASAEILVQHLARKMYPENFEEYIGK